MRWMPFDSALSSCDVIAFVVTTSYERARPFYRDTLGLRLISEDQFALVFDANGVMLRVGMIEEAAPAKHTVLGWRVAGIAEKMEALGKRGVKFEQYGLPNQDASGLWQAPGGAKVAWFKDPDGNTLSLTEFPQL